MSSSSSAADLARLSIDETLDLTEKVVGRLLGLARELAASRGDADEWLRFPAAKGRCPISGWSRSKIDRMTREGGPVRRKTVGSSAFYRGADVRAILAAAKE